MSIYTNKTYAASVAETTFGTYLAPTKANITYPINDMGIPVPDLQITEYGRPADGKMSRGKYISGVVSVTVDWTSLMIESETATSATPGTFANAPIFESAGYHLITSGTEPYLLDNKNPECGTYSWEVIQLGCYDVSALTPVGDGWEIRGSKNEISYGSEAVTAPVVVSVTTTGAVESHEQTATADLVVPSFIDKECDIFLGATVTVGGLALDAQSWMAVQGNTNAILTDPSSNLGAKLTEIRDVDTKVTLTAVVGPTTLDLWNKAISNDPIGDIVVTCQLHTYTFENCSISSYAPGDAEGIIVLTIEASVGGNIEIRKV